MSSPVNSPNPIPNPNEDKNSKEINDINDNITSSNQSPQVQLSSLWRQVQTNPSDFEKW